VLGGITVLYYLPEPVSIAHAGLAQLVFCLTVTIALVTSPGWTGPGVHLYGAANPCAGQADENRLTAREGSGDPPAHRAGVTRSSTPSQRGPATGAGIRGSIQVNSGASASSRAGAAPDDRTLQRLAVATTAAIYVQILVGATMRHTGAGLAIPDFPWAFGRLVPPHWDEGIAIHFAHRVGALVVTGFVAATAGHALHHHWRRPWLARPAALLLALLAAQVTLGALTVLSGRQPIINSLHVVTGASVLATSLVLTLRARRVRFADLPAVPGAAPGPKYLRSTAAAGGTGARA
jgi:heme A synthase